MNFFITKPNQSACFYYSVLLYDFFLTFFTEPRRNYVIQLSAFNKIGYGTPAYSNVVTKSEEEDNGKSRHCVKYYY